MVNLKNVVSKLLLSVAFITVATPIALAGGNGQEHTKICHRLGNGKYIIINPANPGVHNGHMGHGDSLATNGFCPGEMAPTSVPDPCNFQAPPPATKDKSAGSTNGNNGWGNGDQAAPGGSGPNNNAENGPNGNP